MRWLSSANFLSWPRLYHRLSRGRGQIVPGGLAVRRNRQSSLLSWPSSTWHYSVQNIGRGDRSAPSQRGKTALNIRFDPWTRTSKPTKYCCQSVEPLTNADGNLVGSPPRDSTEYPRIYSRSAAVDCYNCRYPWLQSLCIEYFLPTRMRVRGVATYCERVHALIGGGWD
jgi:hypothetical protein